MTNNLDSKVCQALPFIHSLSGRDVTSYPYFTGKKSWLLRSKEVELDKLASFAEESNYTVTEDIVNQARNLLIAVYCKAGEDSLFSSLEEIRAHTFLNKNTTVLKMLPPTEDAFLQHLKRAALATVIDKTVHLIDLPIALLQKDMVGH